MATTGKIWGQLGNTDVYIGIEAIYTNDGSKYAVTLKAYMACQYGLTLYSGGQYHIKVEIGDSSAEIPGIAAYVTTGKDSGGTDKGGIEIGAANFSNINSNNYIIKATFIDTSAYNFYYSGLPLKNLSVSKSLNLPALVSACGAPSKIYFNSENVTKTIIVPSTVTINWTAGTSGTNNPITKYRVYYSIGSAPTTNSNYVDTTSNTTSLSFTKASSRGSTYHFKVQTIGTVTGYNSGISSASATCTVNKEPEYPPLNKNSQTVTSDTSTFSLTVTAGAANVGFPNRRVFYNDTNSHTGQIELDLNSNYQKTITIGGTNQKTMPDTGGNKTYYFWTFDGAEYSTANTIKITRNNKPTFTLNEIKTSNSYKAKNSTYYKIITINGKSNKNCTATIAIYKGSTLLKSEDKTVTTSNSDIASYNILSLIGTTTINSNVSISVKITPKDSYESGSSVTSSTFTIPGAPSSLNTYNQFGTSNLGTNNIMYNKLRVYFYEDASMTTRTASATVGGKAVTAIISGTATTGNQRYVDVTLSGTLTPSAAVIITINLTDGYITKSFTVTGRTIVRAPSVSTLTVNPSTINIFTRTENIGLSCSTDIPFVNDNPSNIAEYYIKSMVVNVASNTSGTNSRNVTIYSAEKNQSDILTVEITKENFVHFGDFNKTSYNGTSTGYVRITFTNIFDQTFTTGYKSYTINYNTNPTTPTLALQYKTTSSGTSWTNFNISNHKLQEGLYIRAVATCQAYTNSTLTAKLYYNTGSGSNILAATKTATVSNGTTAQSKSFYLEFSGGLPQISNTNNWTWTVEISNDATPDIFSNSVSTKVIKQIDPTVKLNSLSYDRSGSITVFNYNISLTNNGVGGITETDTITTTYQFYLSNGTTTTSGIFSNTNGSIEDSDRTAWMQKTVKIKATIQVTTNLKTSTHSSFSNTVTLYIAQPTIAYRSNQLGINTSSPASNTVLDITSYENNKIILLGGKGSGDKRIEINLASDNLYIDII